MGLFSWWSATPEEPSLPPPAAPSKPEDNVAPENYRDKLKGRGAYTEFYDPCAAAAKASMDCMNRTDFDRDACTDYFQAYRDCKKTWMDQKTVDRRRGMKVS